MNTTKIFKNSYFEEDLQMGTSDTKRGQHTKGNLTKFRTSSERAIYTQFPSYVVGVVPVSLLLLVIIENYFDLGTSSITIQDSEAAL